MLPRANEQRWMGSLQGRELSRGHPFDTHPGTLILPNLSDSPGWDRALQRRPRQSNITPKTVRNWVDRILAEVDRLHDRSSTLSQTVRKGAGYEYFRISPLFGRDSAL
jgi:hypothetical protein